MQKFGKAFQYDMTKHNSSPNIMDKWVLASLHALIQFVNEEMAGVLNSPLGRGQFGLPLTHCLVFLAYRLYTVVPRLLKFIDDLTNWYVRLNRKRMRVCELLLLSMPTCQRCKRMYVKKCNCQCYRS